MAGGPGSYVFGEEEKREVLDVLESGYLFRYGQADDPNFKHKVATFEKEFTEKIGVKHAVATTSGTSSLLCCLAALGIGAGDEVIVPGYTFIASISSIILANAIPVLAEIDESLTLDPDDVEKRITPRTKAILPVHMLGNPCDLDRIMAIAKKHKLAVIEDCCQAFGASYNGKRAGTFGDIAAFSLNVFKTITSGDGGVVATNDYDLYERAFGFHDQGHKPSRMGVEVGKRSIIGMNMRMNEVTGAIALAQLRKLDPILDTLRTKKARLKKLLQGGPGYSFRKINDPSGECATLITVLFDTADLAKKFCAKLGVQTISASGWHVYNNMEQILNKKTGRAFNCPFDCPVYKGDAQYHKHMLPRTDDILDRAVNVSVGVVDKGLGAAAGININSTDAEIDAFAKRFMETVKNL